MFIFRGVFSKFLFALFCFVRLAFKYLSLVMLSSLMKVNVKKKIELVVFHLFDLLKVPTFICHLTL